MCKSLTYIQDKILTFRRQSTLATFVVLLIILGLLVTAILIPRLLSAPAISNELTTEAPITLPASLPVRLVIDKIGVDAPFESPMGLLPSNEISVPAGYETVGYYKFGPTPGEMGPSVILGHVDSYQGPAVFYKLGQLKEGDEIKVEREDGTKAVFAVTRLERHAQSGFPTKEVYSDIDHAGLRLITCTGTYDKSVLRYTHNLIVFAELKATTTAPEIQ